MFVFVELNHLIQLIVLQQVLANLFNSPAVKNPTVKVVDTAHSKVNVVDMVNTLAKADMVNTLVVNTDQYTATVVNTDQFAYYDYYKVKNHQNRKDYYVAVFIFYLSSWLIDSSFCYYYPNASFNSKASKFIFAPFL